MEREDAEPRKATACDSKREPPNKKGEVLKKGQRTRIEYGNGTHTDYTYDPARRWLNTIKTANKGGQVTGVKGYRNEKETVYVSKIGYDEYGQRTYIEYGNGVKTSYTYDENRRWLDTIKTTSATDRILQNITYNFDKVGNVRGYENIGENYKTAQNYKYDSLYQLVGVKGQTEYKPRWPEDHEDHHKYVSTYEQSFRFDNIGNMKSKYSEKLDKPHNQHTSSDLNYSFEYKYDPEYAHRTLSADNMYYSYDENGNIINERIDREATKEELEHDIAVADEVYSLDYGIALPNQPSVETKAYSRTYVWNERNLLRTSVENGLVVQYRYGEDGQRAVKSSSLGETLYFNNMWQMSTTPMGMRQTKHIFVGETRIATKNNWWQDTGTEYEKYNTYWYHADHLGSAQLVSNWKGEEYERIEYTPYGEIWVEKVKNGHESINYRFTGKEMDSETGLYYFGARYLDPKYSRWLSTDPALRDYIPQAPVNDEARKNNQNLPGQGGLFNHINSNLYHYGGNNPVRYTDPDGNSLLAIAAVGFCIGAAIETTSQLYDIYKKTGTLDVMQLDGRKIAIQGLSGMASSLLCVTGAGLAIQVAGNAVINSVADLADQLTDNKNGVDGWDVLSSGISGAIGGLVGGKGNKEIGSQLTRMEKRIFGALKKGDFSEIGKAVAYFQKNTGTLAKQFNKEALKDALKNYLPDKIRDNVIEEIVNYVKKNPEE